MSTMSKNGGSPTSFWREHARKKATVAASPKILQLELRREMFSAKNGLNGPIKRI